MTILSHALKSAVMLMPVLQVRFELNATNAGCLKLARSQEGGLS